MLDLTYCDCEKIKVIELNLVYHLLDSFFINRLNRVRHQKERKKQQSKCAAK